MGARQIALALRQPAVVAIGLLLVLIYVSHTPARLGDDQILQRQFLTGRLRQHIELVTVAFGIAAAIALPLGVLLAESGSFWQMPIFLVANLGQAVPSIAMLAVAFTVAGLGFKTTVFALVLYAVLPIVRNTVIGLQSIEPSIVEAALGMGLTRRQTMLRIKLPLSLPIIFAGLRTALVLVIGTATLGNFIGGGGLGDVISAGVMSGRDRILLVGSALVAALALLADWALGIVERSLTPRT